MIMFCVVIIWLLLVVRNSVIWVRLVGNSLVLMYWLVLIVVWLVLLSYSWCCLLVII